MGQNSVLRTLWQKKYTLKPQSTVRRISTLLLMLLAMPLCAQQPLAPTHWYHIRTPHFDVIFKGNFEREAQRTANTLEHLYAPMSQSLGSPPARIPIVLRNQLAQSNAGIYAGGPRRGVFYTFPIQDYNMVGSNEWINDLCIHEFRHVVQHAKLYQGFNKLLYWLGGDGAFGFITGINIPSWFIEGDAVCIETALSQSGRGRIPHFLLRYKVNLLERGGFSYFKQTRYSYNDWLPDHYTVGYLLTTHLRRKYGPNAVADILQQTTRPRLFSTAVQNVTGRTPTQLHQDTNEELKARWTQQLQGLKLTPAQHLTPTDATEPIDYRYPQPDAAGNVIVYKTGISTVGHFVSIDDQQRQQPLITPGSLSSGTSFTAAQDTLLWVEEIPDPRWEHRSHSVIHLYDLRRKRLKALTPKGRYSAAALSPDATQIVALESDESYNHQLVLLDPTHGTIHKRLPNPDNHFYLTPRWSDDGQWIVAVKHAQSKATLTLINAQTGTATDLFPPATAHIGHPTMHGHHVFYNSAHSGIDNIYAVDTRTGQRYQVTSRKYGAYNAAPTADGKWLYFNDFTKAGMSIAKMPLTPANWTPWTNVEDRNIHYHAPLVAQEGNAAPLANVPNHQYPIKRYHPALHLVNLHTWAHNFPDSNTWEIALKSNDVLETTALQLSHQYDFKQKQGNLFCKLSYKSWYPILSLTGNLVSKYAADVTHTKKLGAEAEIPLQFRHGQYTHKVSSSTKSELNYGEKKNWYTQEYTVAYARSSRSSTKDLYTPWHQSLRLSYMHTPYGGQVQGQRWVVRTALSFPVFLKHHALLLYATLQYKDNALLPNAASIPTLRNHQKRAIHTPLTQVLQAHYCLPIIDPDWQIGSLAYVRRIHGYIAGSTTYTNHTKELLDGSRSISLGLFAETFLTTALPVCLQPGIAYTLNVDGSSQWTLSFKVKPIL